jgi:hypothetical protein
MVRAMKKPAGKAGACEPLHADAHKYVYKERGRHDEERWAAFSREGKKRRFGDYGSAVPMPAKQKCPPCSAHEGTSVHNRALPELACSRRYVMQLQGVQALGILPRL